MNQRLQLQQKLIEKGNDRRIFQEAIDRKPKRGN